MKLKNKRLFISRPAGTLLKEWCTAHSIELLDWSLVEFKPVAAVPESTPDVIFYSSPRSVKFSSTIRKLFPNALSASVGKATADSLMEIGVTSDFVGKNAANPKEVAAEFVLWLGNRRVLFPVSNQSLGTVSSVVPEDQREILCVYQTVAINRVVPACDFYVFSSPSNWNAFLVENNPEAVIFAWGKTTGNTIRKSCEIQPIELSESFENQLILELNKLVE